MPLPFAAEVICPLWTAGHASPDTNATAPDRSCKGRIEIAWREKTKNELAELLNDADNQKSYNDGLASYEAQQDSNPSGRVKRGSIPPLELAEIKESEQFRASENLGIFWPLETHEAWFGFKPPASAHQTMKRGGKKVKGVILEDQEHRHPEDDSAIPSNPASRTKRIGDSEHACRKGQIADAYKAAAATVGATSKRGKDKDGDVSREFNLKMPKRKKTLAAELASSPDSPTTDWLGAIAGSLQRQGQRRGQPQGGRNFDSADSDSASEGANGAAAESKQAVQQAKEIQTSESVNLGANHVLQMAASPAGLKNITSAQIATHLKKLEKRVQPSMIMALTSIGDAIDDVASGSSASCTRGLQALEDSRECTTKLKALDEVVKCLAATTGSAEHLEECPDACKAAGVQVSTSAFHSVLKKSLAQDIEQNDLAAWALKLDIGDRENLPKHGISCLKPHLGEPELHKKQEHAIMSQLMDELRVLEATPEGIDRIDQYLGFLQTITIGCAELKRDLNDLRGLVQYEPVTDDAKLTEIKTRATDQESRFGKALKLFPLAIMILERVNASMDQKVADKAMQAELAAALTNLPPRANPNLLEVNVKETVKTWVTHSRLLAKISATASKQFHELSKDASTRITDQQSIFKKAMVAAKSTLYWSAVQASLKHVHHAVHAGELPASAPSIAELAKSFENAAQEIKDWDLRVQQRRALSKGLANFAKEKLVGGRFVPDVTDKIALLLVNVTLAKMPAELPQEIPSDADNTFWECYNLFFAGTSAGAMKHWGAAACDLKLALKSSLKAKFFEQLDVRVGGKYRGIYAALAKAVSNGKFEVGSAIGTFASGVVDDMKDVNLNGVTEDTAFLGSFLSDQAEGTLANRKVKVGELEVDVRWVCLGFGPLASMFLAARPLELADFSEAAAFGEGTMINDSIVGNAKNLKMYLEALTAANLKAKSGAEQCWHCSGAEQDTFIQMWQTFFEKESEVVKRAEAAGAQKATELLTDLVTSMHAEATKADLDGVADKVLAGATEIPADQLKGLLKLDSANELLKSWKVYRANDVVATRLKTAKEMVAVLTCIQDYKRFVAGGGCEYDPDTDSGSQNHFWDGMGTRLQCSRRIDAAYFLFGEKYPDLAASMAEPSCDAVGTADGELVQPLNHSGAMQPTKSFHWIM
ncbi:unnamed protein product [Prorocentrum cordatum]|uniref:Uncharacterized protein n=1 Tax=Prorocentrum cordatum TaxID=2364126 RepID=A0ABN9TDR5_9DINO|nr:unnamed protein product [Polarella glacialis]